MNNNLFSNKNNFKKIGIAMIAILVLITVLSNIKFQSVTKYKEQQQSMADEYSLNGENKSGKVTEISEISESRSEEANKENIILGSDISKIESAENQSTNGGNVQNTVNNNASNIDTLGSKTDKDTLNSSTLGSDTGNDTLNNSTLGSDSNNNTDVSVTQGNSISGSENNPTSIYIEALTCYIEIRCDAISNNMGKWTNSIKDKSIVPSNGVILGTIAINFTNNSTVFDVLKKATIMNNIPMESSQGYVKSIKQIEQLDAGRGSGWLYWVNNVSPNIACSSYTVKNGDHIKWQYTCDYGTEFDKNGNLK